MVLKKNIVFYIWYYLYPWSRPLKFVLFSNLALVGFFSSVETGDCFFSSVIQTNNCCDPLSPVLLFLCWDFFSSGEFCNVGRPLRRTFLLFFFLKMRMRRIDVGVWVCVFLRRLSLLASVCVCVWENTLFLLSPLCFCFCLFFSSFFFFFLFGCICPSLPFSLLVCPLSPLFLFLSLLRFQMHLN